MLTTDELRTLIAGGESDRVEFTVSTTNTDKFGEALCAFANDFPEHGQPGRLIVGVDDAGTVGGLPSPTTCSSAWGRCARTSTSSRFRP